MAARKFGVFGGVFTPAILTILGVIMYLRLPWIVGNAGLWTTIGIVVVAHVVAITTGLSVSSMATDKRVKAGGSYYILSRSLGLPIGGTLGLALFVGLSFSVSLYIIGFSESVLGYFEVPVTTDNIRLCGSLVLLVVTTVTFISTALAIKTQFFIMAAIIVSLASVLIGSGDPAPEVPHLVPLPDAAPLALLFGIFFPAVTGFEAGVSMSGDLRDPRRDIPVGTLSAIAVGLIVYIGLAIFFSLRIPAEELANNPQVLLEYAWIPELVLPGIWGATISSAFGSILGAPRILQACAADGIGPRFFAKGYGPDAEPRNAVLLTFVIALGGILIGELDAIARVVTMFFMTSYAFLNLSCAIESTVSPDFRPDFRIPRLVPLVGAVVCLVLMTQLDPLGMAGASAAMAVVFVVLRRRSRRLEGGDSWAGVWTSVVHWALDRLRKTDSHERNWRPALIAFGGEAGSALAQELGGPSTSVLSDEATSWDERAAACRYHGLPGLSPNTVLVEADAVVEDPAGFLAFLGEVEPRGFTVLVNRDVGAAGGKRIDAWTRGGGRNLSLQLALIRLLVATPRWAGARVRFVAEVADAAERRLVEHRLAGWLKSMRVQADVEVLVSGETALDQLAILSADADLALLGLPRGRDPEQLAARFTGLLGRVRTVLLVQASEHFTDPLAGIAGPDATEAPVSDLPAADALALPDDLALAERATRFHDEVRGVLAAWASDLDKVLLGPLHRDVAELDRQVERSLRQLDRAAELEGERRGRVARRIQLALLDQVVTTLEGIGARSRASGGWLDASVTLLDDGLATCVLGLDEVVDVTLPERAGDELRSGVPEGGALVRLRRHRTVKLRAAAIRALAEEAPAEVVASVGRAVTTRHRALASLDARLAAVMDLADRVVAGTSAGAAHEHRTRAAAWQLQRVEADLVERRAMARAAAVFAQRVADTLLAPKHSVTRTGNPGGWLSPEAVSEPVGERLELMGLTVGTSQLDAHVRRARLRLESALEQVLADTRRQLDEGLLAGLDSTVRALELAGSGTASAPPTPRAGRSVDAADLTRQVAEAVDAAVRTLPQTLALADSASLHALERGELTDVVVRDVEVGRLVGFVMEAELSDRLRVALEELDAACRAAEDALGEGFRVLLALAEPDEPFAADGDLLQATAERLSTLHGRVSDAFAELEAARAKGEVRLDERLGGTRIVEGAEELGRFLRTRDRSRFFQRAGLLGSTARERAVGLGIEAAFGLSSGVLAARALGGGAVGGPLEAALAFRAAVAPSEAVLEELPLPYRRAFLAGHAGGGSQRARGSGIDQRVEECLRAAEAGRSGALLVTGAPGTGLSALLDGLVADHFVRQNVLHVSPPATASGSAEQLARALRLATGSGPDVPPERLLASLPHGSVLVFRDIDRWWLRHPTGLEAIETLCTWIERSSPRLRFVLGCGSSSLALLGQLTPLRELALALVEPPPLDARQLQEVVLSRHGSTGLQLWLGREGSVPSDWQLARLFVALFEHAYGQVGPSLSGWVAHVSACTSEGVVVQRARAVPLDRLDFLPASWVAAIGALALHRRLDAEGLALASGTEPALASTLVRAGFVSRSGDAFELDRFVGPHLVRWLVREGVLG